MNEQLRGALIDGFEGVRFNLLFHCTSTVDIQTRPYGTYEKECGCDFEIAGLDFDTLCMGEWKCPRCGLEKTVAQDLVKIQPQESE
jgi:hypothetical protein